MAEMARKREKIVVLIALCVNNIDMKSQRDKFNLKKHEQKLIVNCLMENNGNVKKSAEQLGLSRVAIYQKLERLGIDPNKFR